MKIRNVRSKEIEFDVSPEHPPTLGTEVKLAISMGDTTIERTYTVTQIEMRGVDSPPPHATQRVVVVKAEGDGADA